MNRHIRNALMKLALLGLFILFFAIIGTYIYPAGSPNRSVNIGTLVILLLLFEEITVRLLFRISRDLDKYQLEKHNEILKSIPGQVEAPPLNKKETDDIISQIDEITDDIEKDLHKLGASEDELDKMKVELDEELSDL